LALSILKNMRGRLFVSSTLTGVLAWCPSHQREFLRPPAARRIGRPSLRSAEQRCAKRRVGNASELRMSNAGCFTAIDLLFISTRQVFPVVIS
jgi:hypothetical protein